MTKPVITKAKLQVTLEDLVMRIEAHAANDALQGTPTIADIVHELSRLVDELDDESENEDNLGDDRGY